MNTNLEQQLTGALERRASGAHLAPHSMGDVRQRAGRIRRRRAAVAAAGVAAVLAVATPLTMSAMGGLDRSDSRPDDSLIATTPPAPPPAPVADPVVITGDAPMGEPPAMAWVDGDTLHLANGATVETRGSYRSAALAGDRILAYRIDEETGEGTVDVLTSSGTLITSTPAILGPVGSADGESAAWPVDEETLLWARSDDEQRYDVSVSHVVAVNDEGVWFNQPGPDGGAGVLAADGTITQLDVLTLNGVHASSYTATTSIDDFEPGSCGAHVSDEDRWETCDHTLMDISRDGSWVLATDSYLDGLGQGTLTILAAEDGARQVEYEATGGLFVDYAWEDATHVAALTYSYSDQVWRMVRLGLDGSVEQMIIGRKGEDFSPPFLLGP